MSHPALKSILFAILLIGGAGVATLLIGNDGSVVLLLTSMLLVLIVALVLLAIILSFRDFTARKSAIDVKQRIDLDVSRTSRTDYWPGRPEGYAGYTDWVAMSCRINDDVMLRSSEEQFALVGFGLGFASKMIERQAEQGVRATFCCENASLEDESKLGWLATIQRYGTDNAGQSTQNLSQVLSVISGEICREGPIQLDYWDKRHNKKSESLKRSKTSANELAGLQAIHEGAKERGRILAESAQVECNQTVIAQT